MYEGAHGVIDNIKGGDHAQIAGSDFRISDAGGVAFHQRFGVG
jgi:hypothetical protein